MARFGRFCVFCAFVCASLGRISMAVMRSGASHSITSVSKQPNFVYILADDLHYDENLASLMPNLKSSVIDVGTTFDNHITVVPLCGPSRASLLAGRFPHNTGYLTNDDQASVLRYAETQHSNLGNWLMQSGYYTAFLGKYVNNFENRPPKGWRHWGGFTNRHVDHQWVGGAYDYFNSSQWRLDYDLDGKEVDHGTRNRWKFWKGTHQADVLGKQTVEMAEVALQENRPFFILNAPLMVHHGSCNGPWDDRKKYSKDDPILEDFLYDPFAHRMRNIAISPCPKFPHESAVKWARENSATKLASYNRTGTGQTIGFPGQRLNSFELERQIIGENKRAQSAVDLDNMLGVIVSGLTRLGVMHNTYLIFTSDNGFHLGQHSQLYGKNQPYETDLRVPLYIRGPEVPLKAVRHHPTNHLDITATIVELAGAESSVDVVLDGQSFTKAMRQHFLGISGWRTWSFAENYNDQFTWHAVRHVDPSTGRADWSLHRWCKDVHEDRDTELYHMSEDDPWQLVNVAAEHVPSWRPLQAADLLADDQALDKAEAFKTSIMTDWWPRLLGYAACEGSTCNDPTGHFSLIKSPNGDTLHCHSRISHHKSGE